MLRGEYPFDRGRAFGLAHELMTLARQARKLAAARMNLVPCARRRTFWGIRLRTIAAQPAWMLRLMEAEATDLADQALRVQQKASRRAWRAWWDEHTIGGAAKVHQLIREPIGFQAARGNIVDEQLKLRAEWAAIWHADAHTPELVWPDGGEAPFHQPSTDAMRRILNTFLAATGLGYDVLSPRALNELPDQGIEALIDLIMLIEEKAEWPDLCSRIVFIAKASGGVRPIGLLFAVVRVQCRLRRIEAQLWEASNSEGFFWATRARGVERCVWEQAAWSEWATADGHAVATILYDLLKAFDHVAYQKLIDAAVRTRFPMRQLKLLLQLYRAPRYVELDGVTDSELRAQRGIIPGCAFETTLLQLLLVGPLRDVRAAHPTVSIRVVVDDLSLQRFGDQQRVAHELELASRCMAGKLRQAGCEVATKKSKVLSNSVFVRAKLQMRLAPLGVQATRAERNLGIDFSSGKRASTAVRRARLEKSKGRVKRIRKIHGSSAVPLRQRLAKANHFGVAVTGLNETQLQQSRSQLASCLAKRLHGKSVTIVLMTAGDQLDPVFDSLAPVVALTHALWDGWMPQATMAKCDSKAQAEQRDNARPWTTVKGPFGAAVATLKRLQWVILEHDPFLWCMQDGRIVDPRRVCSSSSEEQRGPGNGGVLPCTRDMRVWAVERSLPPFLPRCTAQR